VLSGRGLCVGLIARPEESYRAWCVPSQSLGNEKTLTLYGLLRHGKKQIVAIRKVQGDPKRRQHFHRFNTKLPVR
jgi:hypothetical protein